LAADLQKNADELFGTENGTVHVPHGHRHISEQTHARIAEALDGVVSEANSGIGIPSDSTQGDATSAQNDALFSPSGNLT